MDWPTDLIAHRQARVMRPLNFCKQSSRTRVPRGRQVCRRAYIEVFVDTEMPQYRRRRPGWARKPGRETRRRTVGDGDREAAASPGSVCCNALPTSAVGIVGLSIVGAASKRLPTDELTRPHDGEVIRRSAAAGALRFLPPLHEDLQRPRQRTNSKNHD